MVVLRVKSVVGRVMSVVGLLVVAPLRVALAHNDIRPALQCTRVPPRFSEPGVHSTAAAVPRPRTGRLRELAACGR